MKSRQNAAPPWPSPGTVVQLGRDHAKISGISTLSITVTIFYTTEFSKSQRAAGKYKSIGTIF